MAKTPDTEVRVISPEILGRLPMFPLPGVTLFPRALLPLHIFEDRYRTMTRDILIGHRHLAMAMLRSPDDATAPGQPPVFPVMGVGEIVQAHELPDGRFNLILRGIARVRLEEELPSDEPYRLIRASALPDTMDIPVRDLADAAASLRALVLQLSERVTEGGDLLRHLLTTESNPAALVDVLAAALLTDSTLRQTLIETNNPIRRLELVAREIVRMTDRLGGAGKAN